MTFIKRGLSIVIRLNQGPLSNSGLDSPAAFSNGETKLVLSGLRCVASLNGAQGGTTPFVSQALIQLWGMNPADMAVLSSLGVNPARIGRNNIQVNAYNVGQDETFDNPTPNDIEVFSGGIFNAHINYNAMPDVSLELECYGAIDQQTQAIAGTSMPGAVDVATMLQGICAACNPPVTFINAGVLVKLSNPVYAGSPELQIRSICQDAGINYTLQGGVLTVWNRGQNIDGIVIATSPDKGMVGYPEYNSMGFDVTMEFNPEVKIGRYLTVEAPTDANALPIPGVPGTYYIWGAAHELSSEMPDGPWFTRARLAALDTYPHRS